MLGINGHFGGFDLASAGSSSEWGSEGREFKSHRPDHLSPRINSAFTTTCNKYCKIPVLGVVGILRAFLGLEVTTDDDQNDDQ